MTALFGGPFGPLLIFGLRVVDVSLGTVRMLLMVRRHRVLVPIIGFIEIMIWILAVGNTIQFLTSPLHVIGYAAGFAAGNVVGLWVEEWLALGLATVRIIAPHQGVELADALRDRGFGVTEFAGQGREGPVEVVFTATRRARVPEVMEQVGAWAPDAFVTVDEPRAVHRGWMFPQRKK